MSSDEIKQIYKKLVQSYVNSYPKGDPLWVLNKHLDAYVRSGWKVKEPAIVDLALREGIEIPQVKELIEKGRTRKEAILEVSKTMKLQVSEAETELWLKELRKETPRMTQKVTERRMELRIKEYKKAIEKLTTLFSKDEISEESYKVAIKKIEKDIEGLRSGEKIAVIEEEKERTVKPKTSFRHYPAYTEPTKLWYLVPFFFGLIGGLIGYVGVKDDDKEMASNLLAFGIIMTFLNVLAIWLFLL